MPALSNPNIAKEYCTAKAILAAVSDLLEISQKDIFSPMRFKEVCEARHLVAYLLRTHTKLSLLEVAMFLHRSDHSTIINSVRVVRSKWGHYEPKAASVMSRITR